MLVVDTVIRFRREYAKGRAITATARDLRLSRTVVRKAIRAPEGAFDYHRTVQPLPRLGAFQERLDTRLTENETRRRRDPRRIHFLTGTEDSLGLGGDPSQVLASRRAPFDAIEGPPTSLVSLNVGDHLVFSGWQEMGERQPRDKRFHDIIRTD